jgi:prevent-host-death family protein
MKLSISTARNGFADILNKVSYQGERIIFQRRGKDIAAIVPIDDLMLLEELEDRFDLEAIRLALAEPGTVPLEELKRELKL